MNTHAKVLMDGRILQGIFHIFNHLFAFPLYSAIPDRLHFLSGIVLNILKEMQKAVAVCAAVIHGAHEQGFFQVEKPQRVKLPSGENPKQSSTCAHRISSPTFNLSFLTFSHAAALGFSVKSGFCAILFSRFLPGSARICIGKSPNALHAAINVLQPVYSLKNRRQARLVCFHFKLEHIIDHQGVPEICLSQAHCPFDVMDTAKDKSSSKRRRYSALPKRFV